MEDFSGGFNTFPIIMKYFPKFFIALNINVKVKIICNTEIVIELDILYIFELYEKTTIF